jgi:HEAT repeat protein
LNAYARSGLEGIGDPSAAAALRGAAQKLKGPLLAGVVNSLGVLRDRQSIGLLTALAADPASGSAGEALLALGNISTPESIRFLRGALISGPNSFRGQAAAACLLAADRQRAGGDLSTATALYDLIRKAEVRIALRVAATRGAILARGADRGPFLIEQLRSEDIAVRNAALLTVREISDDTLATVLNTELTRATPEMQGQLLLALADCHNAQSIPAVQALVKNSAPETRKTAFTVLSRMGPDAAPVLLASLQKDQPPEERSTVLSALRGLPGSSVDDWLLRALTATEAAQTRIDLIRLLDERGVGKASPDLLKQAGASDKNVSVAALSALKSLAGPSELSALIALAKSRPDDDFRNAGESALAGICSRSGDPACETVLSELERATKPDERNLWIAVLAGVGYPKALPLIEAAAGDPNLAVADQAIAQLGRWPDPAPMEILLETMETGKNPTSRKCSLNSVIDLAANAADEAQRPPTAIVEWLQRANNGARDVPEKRRILGVLGQLKTVESFRLLASYLDNPDLRTEAASGVVGLAPTLARAMDASELKAALEQVAATVTNGELRDRALRETKAIAGQRAVVTLFDGQSLAGWEGDPNVWHVRDRLIVGGSMNGNPRNEFLATVDNYTNFFLSLEYKLVGTEGFINSGVQFRSVRVKNPPNEMNGYQADIGAGHSGCLYDESRRNQFLARCPDETIKRLEKAGDWNLYELRCEGTHIQIWLNGEKTVDYAEPNATIPQSGLIGLQIHGGNKAEVSFRNITIQGL